ncbi:hypothetical protein DENSPDRAFT_743739, partial [Dentipellis sp. KUC8613]
KEWLPYRDVFLRELLRHDGLASSSNGGYCVNCGLELGSIKCKDCVSSGLLCPGCIVEYHSAMPLHRIERWTGSQYTRYSLAEAGLTMHLGHDGLQCPNPRPRDGLMHVIDSMGFHSVAIVYCGCEQLGTHHAFVQLLRAGWVPATINRPQTVVTLSCLKLFQKLNLQGRINAYDFYRSLEAITDGTGLFNQGDRYKEFLRVSRWYRFLQMAKHCGRAYDPLGLDNTSPGEMVVECPLCPQPGRNLPDNWAEKPESEAWIYALFLAIDANFKLKRKKRKKDNQEELAPGWAYFVHEKEYQEYLVDYLDQPEMKYCDSQHSAIDHANIPAMKRFAVNGVGAVICSRHCFYRKHGVVDLQRGERYCNMDYALFSTIVLTALTVRILVMSYDIACSFSKNFFNRRLQQPPRLQGNFDNVKIKWAVPKFHLLAHGPKCQKSYSLNNMPGVGRTHGEGIESNWAITNSAALSTREMGAASRHEVLNDVFGAVNWTKTTRIRVSMDILLTEAIEEREIQRAFFAEFESTIPRINVANWELMVEMFEKDQSNPNPYEEIIVVDTLVAVRTELAEEEAGEVSRGVMSMHELTASQFLNVGMDLEEQQRVLRARQSTTGIKTANFKLLMQEKSNVLRNRINAWRVVQQVYMPGVSRLLEAGSEDTSPGDEADNRPEYAKLWLPSELPLSLHESGCAPSLLQKELRLRVAQADDTLHLVRRQIRVRFGLIHYKSIHVNGPGQKANTRVRNLLTRVTEKLDRLVRRYRHAYTIISSLHPNGSWASRLQELKDEDLRGPTTDDEGLGRGRRQLVWIWRAQTPDARDVPGLGDGDVHDSMRAEWAAGRARVKRWEEEVELLQEEMRRAVKFFEYRENEWLQKAGLGSEVAARYSPDIASGLDAYARRQAATNRLLALSCAGRWHK